MPEDAAAAAAPEARKTIKLRVMIRGLPADTPRKPLSDALNDNGVPCSVSPTYYRKPGEYTATLKNGADRAKLEEILNEKYVIPSQQTDKPIVLKITDLPPAPRAGNSSRSRSGRQNRSPARAQTAIERKAGEKQDPSESASTDKATTEPVAGAEDAKITEQKSTQKPEAPATAAKPVAKTEPAPPVAAPKPAEEAPPRPGGVYFNMPIGGTEDDVRALLTDYPHATVFVGKRTNRKGFSKRLAKFNGFVVITVREDEQKPLIESLQGKQIKDVEIQPTVSVIRSKPKDEASEQSNGEATGSSKTVSSNVVAATPAVPTAADDTTRADSQPKVEKAAKAESASQDNAETGANDATVPSAELATDNPADDTPNATTPAKVEQTTSDQEKKPDSAEKETKNEDAVVSAE